MNEIESTKTCPIPSTHDKYEEAFYFLMQMVEHYHHALEFRFNLSAFIQAFRNITFMLQSEDNKPPNFEEWYKSKQEQMRSDERLKQFVEARNVVVKQRMLETRSRAFVGVFEGFRKKAGVEFESSPFEISPFEENDKALELAKKMFIGFLIDEEHTWEGEQLGIHREWVVEEIGEKEIVTVCIEALDFMGSVVKEAHELHGVGFEPYDIKIDMDRIKVLLESDLDPTLPKKWGWVD